MNLSHILIAVLLGIVTFLGFTVVQEHESSETVSTAEEVITVPVDEREITGEPVDKGIAGGPNGKIITMQNQGLTSVPESVFTQVTTTELNLSYNTLDGSLPAEVRHLQSLRVLDISHNNFTGVPAEIGQLANLEILNLSGNPITGLPLELGNLKKLRLLDLRDTDYSQYDLDIITASLSSGIEIKTD